MSLLTQAERAADSLPYAGGRALQSSEDARSVSPAAPEIERRLPFATVADVRGLTADRVNAGQPLARPEGGTLAAQEPYSHAMARLFKLESVQTLATTTLKSAQLAITRLSSAAYGPGFSSPMPLEKAYMVCLQLQDAFGNELWTSGRPVAGGPFAAGSIVIADLEDEPVLNHRAPFDSLLMHIPQIAFDELADDHGARRIRELTDEAGTLDPVVLHLGRALLPCFEADAPTPRLFFDHVAFAIHSRLASRYGVLRDEPGHRVGGLTAWQERVAKEAMVADLGEEPSMAKVANACGLSVGRLVRAFRQSTGMPPYRWLRQFRVERSKDLLLNSNLALAQIAYECGFADQSHFTRVFTATVGTSPGAWRRGRCG